MTGPDAVIFMSLPELPQPARTGTLLVSKGLIRQLLDLSK
jgi:hypothetical protein